MSLVFGFIILLLGDIVGFALPALLVAWLFTLVLPVAFDQALWLSLGMIIAVAYIIQSITDIPGKIGYGLMEILISVLFACVLLALSGLFGWLLLLLVAVDLTIFEAILLFAISLLAGFFFLTRSGSVGLPKWMTLSNIELEDEYAEEDYVVPPPRKRSKRKQRSSR